MGILEKNKIRPRSLHRQKKMAGLDLGKAGFQVKYEVRETNIGKGLFLLEPEAKGTLIWRYREGENILCFRNEAETRKHLDSMSSDADRLDFLEHCFHDGGVLNTILDDGKLVNHSRCPTMGKMNNMEEHLSSFSLRALEVGEELTEDYGTYEYPGWLLAICKEF